MNTKEKILLLIIILFGFFLRFYGINWDATCCQHPDERAIVMYTTPLSFPKNIDQFLTPQSPLNPHFFAYGNFPLYLLKGASLLAGNIDPSFLQYDKINLIGRLISIISDTGTIIIIFLLGKILFNKKSGFLAAFVYAVSALPIQYSHFFTSDILLTFIISLILLTVINFYKKPSLKSAIFIGILFGLALATKISAIPIIISITLAITLDFLFIFTKSPHKPKLWINHLPHVVKKLISEWVLIMLIAFITFSISQPYAIIDSQEFVNQNMLQSMMTKNPYIFPYTLQYVGKIPYIYELKNIFLWGLGPIISVLSFAGLALTFFNFKKYKQDKKAEIILISAFLISYFAVVGSFAIGFMRYLLPIYPLLAIFGGFCFYKLFELFASFIKNSYAITFLKFVVILLVLIWPLSFVSIYSRVNTRIDATNWINKNIPQNSTIAIEHWDDRLPLNSPNTYNFSELTMYDQPDNAQKWQVLSSKLSGSNYLIIASNRLYVPIQKLSNCNKYKVCYPLASQYYKALFSGKLPFKLVSEFTSYPTIPFTNIKIPDDTADESFTVYDHPKIYIFKKTP
ncbi:MAG TPA: glycosyltransferase family 39 protein [Patescibacteria group bacterium]|nr:glycosyltransferase family 39 protein [Patescibacteria group bacterium]